MIKYEYHVVVGDNEQCSYLHTTRDEARKELQVAKADGFSAYIRQDKYERVESKQVR